MSETTFTKGKYRARGRNPKFGKTSKGNEQVYADFEITSGPHAGKSLGWYGFFTDATAERTLESLEYAGWDGESLRELKGFGTKEVEIVVEDKKGTDGRDYLEIRWINKIGGGIKEELDAGGLSSLEQRMKGLMLKRKQERPAAAKPMRESGDDSFDRDFGPTEYGDEPPV